MVFADGHYNSTMLSGREHEKLRVTTTAQLCFVPGGVEAGQGQPGAPTNNALLRSFRQNSDAEILFMSTD